MIFPDIPLENIDISRFSVQGSTLTFKDYYSAITVSGLTITKIDKENNRIYFAAPDSDEENDLWDDAGTTLLIRTGTIDYEAYSFSFYIEDYIYQEQLENASKLLIQKARKYLNENSYPSISYSIDEVVGDLSIGDNVQVVIQNSNPLPIKVETFSFSGADDYEFYVDGSDTALDTLLNETVKKIITVRVKNTTDDTITGNISVLLNSTTYSFGYSIEEDEYEDFYIYNGKIVRIDSFDYNETTETYKNVELEEYLRKPSFVKSSSGNGTTTISTSVPHVISNLTYEIVADSSTKNLSYIKFTWVDNKNSDVFYRIYSKKSTDTDYVDYVDVYGKTYNFENPYMGYTYNFKFYAVRKSNSVMSDAYSQDITLDAISVPSFDLVTDTVQDNDSLIQIAITSVSNAKYEIYWSYDQSSWSSYTTSEATTSFHVIANKLVYVKARLIKYTLEGDFSDVQSITSAKDEIAPAAVTLTATANSSSDQEVVLTWTESTETDFDHYTVQISKSDTFSTIYKTVSTTGTEYTTALPASKSRGATDYYIRILSYDNSENYSTSNVGTFTSYFPDLDNSINDGTTYSRVLTTEKTSLVSKTQNLDTSGVLTTEDAVPSLTASKITSGTLGKEDGRLGLNIDNDQLVVTIPMVETASLTISGNTATMTIQTSTDSGSTWISQGSIASGGGSLSLSNIIDEDYSDKLEARVKATPAEDQTVGISAVVNGVTVVSETGVSFPTPSISSAILAVDSVPSGTAYVYTSRDGGSTWTQLCQLSSTSTDLSTALTGNVSANDKVKIEGTAGESGTLLANVLINSVETDFDSVILTSGSVFSLELDACSGSVLETTIFPYSIYSSSAETSYGRTAIILGKNANGTGKSGFLFKNSDNDYISFDYSGFKAHTDLYLGAEKNSIHFEDAGYILSDSNYKNYIRKITFSNTGEYYNPITIITGDYESDAELFTSYGMYTSWGVYHYFGSSDYYSQLLAGKMNIDYDPWSGSYVDVAALHFNDLVGEAYFGLINDDNTWLTSTRPIKIYDDNNTAWFRGLYCYFGTSAPSIPLTGMCWYDTSNHILYIYDGSSWRAV